MDLKCLDGQCSDTASRIIVCNGEKSIYCQTHADKHSEACINICNKYNLYRKIERNSKKDLIDKLLLLKENTNKEIKSLTASYDSICTFLNKIFNDSFKSMENYLNFCDKQIQAISDKNKSIVFYSVSKPIKAAIDCDQLDIEIKEYCLAEIVNLNFENLDIKKIIKDSSIMYLPQDLFNDLKIIDIKLLEFSDQNMNFMLDFNNVIKKDSISYKTISENYKEITFNGIYKGEHAFIREIYYDYKVSNEKIFQIVNSYIQLSLARSSENCFIEFYGYQLSNECLYLVTKYFPKNIEEVIEEFNVKRKVFDEELIISMFTKILNSFYTMKQLGIFYCDIRPDNFYVDENLNIKIIPSNYSKYFDTEIIDEKLILK
ncbi:hypothetical protein SteCoe_2064 [Stentor coeruleus]|uniref:Protein kinase domain-containing protein n=1 Tax=Stentor coeruleus TaxID=5963 RepID=A0A1R2D0G4_9CILI|nr:hypothetical protein SteCoe_2064 [Stentor coeruleus]